jgi:Tfp pilus assembly protein PilO
MFRFTIRDVLILIAVLALALGWTLDRSRLAQNNRELLTQRNRLADTKAQMVVQRERLEQQLKQVRSAGNNQP